MPDPDPASDRPPDATERALLMALRAFGSGADDPAWGRLAGPWRTLLDGAWRAIAGRFDPPSARAALAREHAAEARPDPTRIHPSWWVRALRLESPTVRLAVAMHAPEPHGPALRRAFAAEAAAARFDATFPPDPEAIGWALALAGERFVGGPPRREDDPPIVRVIAALDAKGCARVIAALGLAKLAYAGRDDAARPRDRPRCAAIRAALPTPRPELASLALAELAAIHLDAGDAAIRNPAARLGLRSFGRLLAGVAPHRARWALQHLPYPVARSLPGFMTLEVPSMPAAALRDWESGLLRAALVLLIREGRVDPLLLADPEGVAEGSP